MRRGLKHNSSEDALTQSHSPRARPPMRRGLKPDYELVRQILPRPPRARPPMRRGLKPDYELVRQILTRPPRARPPMRRGLKLCLRGLCRPAPAAARAAPYEKGTETLDEYFGGRSAHREIGRAHV